MNRKNNSSFKHIEVPRVRLSEVSYPGDEAGQPLLAGVSLTVRPGEMLAIVASASINRVLLDLISGLEEPCAGSIELEGQDLREMSAQQRAWLRREKIGIVMPAANLVDDLTAAENIALVYELSGISHQQALSRAGVALANVRASEFGDRYPQQLDLFNQQKIAITRAGLGGAKLILAFDPVTELDVAQGKQILHMLRTQVENGNSCLLFSTRESLADFADRSLKIQPVASSCRGVER
ncbi:ATP-binding cassette domain-containing protein [Varibaculum vaginae]|uniref:ATP-binding cassette domain-containing protein n=1 Tax=Varibaculum vaginae TaxID=2364797 RepID=UPI000F078318|nr:ATP-binding cassette domain-containing protein [Varibaculum vaginae]